MALNILPDDDDSSTHSSGSSSGDGGDAEGVVLTVNRKYAQKYNERKGREELQKKRSDRSFDERKLNRSDDDSGSSSSSDEDEEAEMLTPALDVAIHRVINRLRKKDDRIYDPNVKFFVEKGEEDESDDSDGEEESPKKVHKRMTYKDVVREQTMERMDGDDGNSDDEEQDYENSANDRGAPHRLAYDDEQRKIRAAFLVGEDNEEDNGDDDILLVKKKEVAEWNAGDEEYREALRKEIEDGSGDGDRSDKVTSNGGVKEAPDHMGRDGDEIDGGGEDDEGKKADAFLKDFLLNRRWVDNVKYDDAEEDDGNGEEVMRLKGSSDLQSDSEDSVERMDAFESKYNFRFEERESSGKDGAAGQIVGYARGSSAAHVDSYRKVDDKRKKARELRKERKVEERRMKEEELRRLKNARRNELKGRLDKIIAVSGLVTRKNKKPEKKAAAADETSSMPSHPGSDVPGFDEGAVLKLLEGDYDPDEFSKKMEDLMYDEDYYNQEDAEWKTPEDVKRALAADGEVNVDVVEYSDDDADDNDDDDNNNAEDDEDDNADDEYQEGAETEETAVLDSFSEKAKAKIQEEMYKLDYEDMIDELPCRFKYRSVEKNDYGLSASEILVADDKKLKQFVSLKKMVPYNERGEYHTTAKQRKRFREAIREDYDDVLKKNESNSLVSSIMPTSKISSEKNKLKRRKKGKKGDKKSSEESNVQEEVNNHENISELNLNNGDEKINENKSTKKRRRNKKKSNKSSYEKVSDEPMIVPEITTTGSIHGKKEKKKRKSRDSSRGSKKKKASNIEGISESRLASYGL